jgi:hypothetical protein
MPDNYDAKASVWMPYMRDVLKCDADTVLVGHSSGAEVLMAMMRNNREYCVVAQCAGSHAVCGGASCLQHGASVGVPHRFRR